MGLFGLAPLVTYANTVVAMLFRGEVSLWRIGDAELYAYSAVWLAFGSRLARALAPISAAARCRLASAALVALAVLKVFLIDMAGLTGLWRALSFIGLGLVLLVVGRIYQRVLGIAQAKAAGASRQPAGPSRRAGLEQGEPALPPSVPKAAALPSARQASAVMASPSGSRIRISAPSSMRHSRMSPSAKPAAMTPQPGALRPESP